ncbi:MAG: hypothetical protein A3J72_02705 [Nitrospirae bacterium RIFCSPHIGHO2_02_FULL_40_19]|nr:MAG: hypothetical protein A3J72_02705 [Nitrospirae bacterium RIFCSPHIGHO2_02_FULL_40_19]
MKTKAYPLRISEDVLTVSKLRSEEEHVDQSTALRQFLHTGADAYVLQLVEKGRLSIGKAAELLNTSVYDLQHLAEKYGISLGSTPEQAEKSRRIAKKLFR